MWSCKLMPWALMAGSLFVTSQPFVIQERDPGFPCVDISELRDPKEAQSIWHSSIAGVFGDEWINGHGHEHWAQDMDQAIFGEDTTHSWSCYDIESRCELNRQCSDYVEHGNKAPYYLFRSLAQLHTFLRAFHERLQDNAIKEILDIEQIQNDLEDKSDADINVPVIISATFGILAGAFAANPALAGAFGIASGVSSIVGNSKPPTESDGDAEPQMSKRVQASFEQMRTLIDDINGAVFGKPGKGQDLVPAKMQKQEFANPAINALGNGQWLIANPAQDLEDTMDEVYKRMKQSLAWAMMRVSRHAFVFIDGPVTKSECGYNYNSAAWDDNLGHCFRLFYNKDDEIWPVPDKLADKLWADDGEYGINKLEAYRNAYDCWMEADGEMGRPVFNKDLPSGEAPACLFAMKVVKGTYFKPTEAKGGKHGLIRTYEFPGQTSGGMYDNSW